MKFNSLFKPIHFHFHWLTLILPSFHFHIKMLSKFYTKGRIITHTAIKRNRNHSYLCHHLYWAIWNKRFPEYDDQRTLAKSHGTNMHETDVEALPSSILNVILGKDNPSPHKVHFGPQSCGIRLWLRPSIPRPAPQREWNKDMSRTRTATQIF